MKTIEMDLEKLQVMTQTRADMVTLHLEQGWKTDWEFVEDQVAAAVKDLERERSVEPFRAAGRSLREFINTITTIFDAFNEGFNEHD